jgi:two-component system response regulator YesN
MGIRSIVNWEEYGYTIVADASSGSEALEKIAECHPDIVLTDLVMENMDGFELIRRSAEKYPEIRFVVLSSHNDFENVRKAMKLGAKDYIFKLTANQDEILRILDELSADQMPFDGRNQKLDTVIKENLQIIKFNLLRKWVNGSIERREDLLSQFSTLAPKVDLFKPYFILYVSIDDFERRRLAGEFQDEQLLKASMENIMYEIFNKSNNLNAEVFNGEKGDAIVFVNTIGNAGDKITAENHKDEFYKIREYCKRYLGFAVSGTFSPVLEGPDGIPEVIRICEGTLRQRTAAAELWPYNSGLRNEIALAMDYISGHVTGKMGIQEIASVAGMSESYFSHLFKKETGVNVIDYVNHRKMEKAMEILKDHRVKIADAAEQLGIDNANYFSVLFKKVVGMSPQEYREKCRDRTQGG